MKFASSSSSLLSLVCLPLTAAFAPPRVSNNGAIKTTLNFEATVSSPPSSLEKPIFDPLGLYSPNSPERMAGLIQPLEVPTNFAASSSSFQDDGSQKQQQQQQVIFDPLRLYTDQSQATMSPEETSARMSSSLPFLPRPALLDGTLPGDRGFDPFNFASDDAALRWQRKAELKHSRLAMLAAVGWPLAEQFHMDIASALDLPYSLASGGRVPSVLNDGLAHADFPIFWIAVLSAAAAIEMLESVGEYQYPVEMGLAASSSSSPYLLGEEAVEGPSHFVQEAEIFNGRLGMLAITAFAIQECLQNSAVIDHWSLF